MINTEYKRRSVAIYCLVVCTFMLVGCEKGEQATDQETERHIEFITVEQGTFSGVTDHRLVAVIDQSAWETLWSKHASKVLPSPEVPKVDFSADMVIAVFDGEKSTGGFSIEIVSIAETSTKRVVRVVSRIPAPDAMVTMALTQPFHIVTVKLTDKRIEFDVSSE